MNEKLRNKEAFEYFLSLGGEATESNCRKVASKFQRTERTFWNWYKKFNWKEQVEQRTLEIAKKLEEKVDKTIVNSRANYRALIGKVVKEFEKKLKAGKIRIDKPEDLSIMAKLDLLMMGEATEKQDVTYKLLDTDISKYPKAKNAVSVQAKDKRAKKGD